MGGTKWLGGDDQPSDSFRFGREFGDEDHRRWATRRIVESTCKTEEVEPGRFVRKCDKTEKIFRDCIGRPTEVVESKTEHTEDDVTDEVTSGLLPFGSCGAADPFPFPGLRDGFEAIEQGIRSDFESIEKGFSRFLDAADEMADGFLKSFGIPSREGGRESSPFGRERPADRQLEGDTSSKQMDESAAYSEYAGELRDV